MELETCSKEIVDIKNRVDQQLYCLLSNVEKYHNYLDDVEMSDSEHDRNWVRIHDTWDAIGGLSLTNEEQIKDVFVTFENFISEHGLSDDTISTITRFCKHLKVFEFRNLIEHLNLNNGMLFEIKRAVSEENYFGEKVEQFSNDLIVKFNKHCAEFNIESIY